MSPREYISKVHPDETHVAILEKSSFDYIVRTGLAGGAAGCAGKTLIAPLDRIKILFQTSNPHYRAYSHTRFGLLKAAHKIYTEGGIFGFFQGHSATLLRIFPYAAIKFVAYEQVRRVLIPSDQYETGLRRLLSGSIAGLCSVFVTYPLDLIRVRLAYETSTTHSRLLKTVANIYKESPVQLQGERTLLITSIRQMLPKSMANLTNFYRGFFPTILGMIPYAGVSFWTHDFLHDVLRHHLLEKYTVDSGATMSILQRNSKSQHEHRLPLNTWAQLLAGGLAGMVSQTAAYPFEVIRRRLQVGGVKNNGQFLSGFEMSKIIWRERGFRGFYVGLTIGFIKVVPMVACSFWVYERCKFHLGV